MERVACLFTVTFVAEYRRHWEVRISEAHMGPSGMIKAEHKHLKNACDAYLFRVLSALCLLLQNV
jgi:hypothetical protein